MKASVLPSILATVALLAFLPGCQKQDERAAAPSRESPQTVATTRYIAPLPAGDPSLPDAATALAADDAADKAKADADAAAAEQAPQAEMTKKEESDTMPRAGQANDHSSTALDKRTRE